ncbi:unnamed protein product, partial [Nesidiocoris tenuis]
MSPCLASMTFITYFSARQMAQRVHPYNRHTKHLQHLPTITRDTQVLNQALF